MENKKRLVYAEDVRSILVDFAVKRGNVAIPLHRIINILFDESQTVDAIEVVRCKDCQHYEKKWSYYKLTSSEDVGCGYCWHWEYETGMGPNQVDGDDFCSYGERKDND